MNHLDEMTCLLYLDGQLEGSRSREFATHTSGCAECRALLGALEHEGRWLREALAHEEETVPAHLLEPRARAAMPWGWIAALGFGAAGAYTLWTGLIEPVRQQLSLAGFGEGNLLTMLLFQGTFWKGWQLMRSLMEFLAVGTLCIGLFALARRGLRRFTTVGLVMGSLLCALLLPSPAAATEICKARESYTLRAGQNISGDLIVAASVVRIEGNVDGDLIVFGQSVHVDGHVTGDIIAFAQEIRVTGPVDGNLRIFARSFIFDGPVAKNASVFADAAELDSKSQIGRSLYLFASVATLDGHIGRDVLAYVAHSQLSGSVGGDFKIRSDRLVIHSSADVRGHSSFTGEHSPEVEAGANLASPLEVHIQENKPEYASPRYFWHQILIFGSAFLYGLVLLLSMPDIFRDIVRAANRFGVSAGFGALLLIATPILAVISCLTLIGIGIGIASVLLWLMVMYAAQCFIGTWLGGRILGTAGGTGQDIGRLAVGLVIIRIAAALPYVGGWVKAGVIVWGMGALAVALYRRRVPQQQPVTA